MGTTLSLSRDGRDVGKLTSKKTFWENRSQPSTEVGIFSTFKEDLYLNLVGWEGQTAQLHLQRFALVSWIWGGAWIVYLGAAMALVGPVRAAKQGKQVKAWGEKNVLVVRHLKKQIGAKQILKDVSFQAGLGGAAGYHGGERRWQNHPPADYHWLQPKKRRRGDLERWEYRLYCPPPMLYGSLSVQENLAFLRKCTVP